MDPSFECTIRFEAVAENRTGEPVLVLHKPECLRREGRHQRFSLLTLD
jgi:hypothetical protein